jgi:hypothetical protein
MDAAMTLASAPEPLPFTRDLLLKEVLELDAALAALAAIQLQILDKMTAARLRLQLINKKLQTGAGQ